MVIHSVVTRYSPMIFLVVSMMAVLLMLMLACNTASTSVWDDSEYSLEETKNELPDGPEQMTETVFSNRDRAEMSSLVAGALTFRRHRESSEQADLHLRQWTPNDAASTTQTINRRYNSVPSITGRIDQLKLQISSVESELQVLEASVWESGNEIERAHRISLMVDPLVDLWAASSELSILENMLAKHWATATVVARPTPSYDAKIKPDVRRDADGRIPISEVCRLTKPTIDKWIDYWRSQGSTQAVNDVATSKIAAKLLEITGRSFNKAEVAVIVAECVDQ